jgi:hypothetical protein
MENEKIEVSKDLLANIQKELETLRKDRDMLLEIADEKKKATYFARNQQALPRIVHLRTLTLDEKGMPVEKVVVGWRTVKDEVFKDPVSMRWQEIQIIEVIFDDGTSKQLHLLDWVRQYKLVKAEVLERSENEQTKELVFKVKRIDTGKEYSLNSTFVN